MVSRTLWAWPFLLLLLAGCTGPAAGVLELPDSQQIYNGTAVNSYGAERPYVVMISLDTDQGGELCTGTFISRRLILTAAHCVDPMLTRMRVLYGVAPFAGHPFEEIPVQRVHIYRNTNGATERDDIALIEYRGGLPDGARYAKLPGKRQLPAASGILEFVGVGYGRTTGVEAEQEYDNQGAGELRRVGLVTEHFQVNQKSFIIDQKKVERGVCFGDSGGPAFIPDLIENNFTVIGIASGIFSDKGVDENVHGFNFCSQKSIYMNVQFYLPWIENIQYQVGDQMMPQLRTLNFQK